MTTIIKIRPDVEYMPPENYEPPELKILVKEDREDIKFCAHEQIQIYPHHWIITCSACQAKLDPFEYLLAVGKQEGGHLSHLKYYKIQIQRLRDEEESLKKSIASLKRQGKRLKP